MGKSEIERELIAAQRERARMLGLLRQVPAALTILRGDDLFIEFAHPSTVAAVGGRQLEGRELLEALPEFADQPHVARMRRVLETGETSVERVVAQVDKSGSGELEESHWHSTYQPIRSAEGAIEGLLLFDIDITKEVQGWRRLELLQELTSSLSRALTVQDVARIVVEEGTAKLSAPCGGVWALSEDRTKLELLDDKGYSDALRDAVGLLSVDSPLPIARVLTMARPCWLESREDYARQFGAANADTYDVRTSDETAFFCAPMLVDEKAVGCVSFNYDRRHSFSEEERRFIEALVDQFALALHRAQLLASERSARDAAEKDQRRFRAVFEQSLDGIVLTDDAMCIVDANPAACAMLRRDRCEVVGRSGADFQPFPREEFDEQVAEFRTAGQIERQERYILLPDGTARSIEIHATANVVPGLHLTTFRDIEDRKRADEAARYLEEANRRLASSLDPERTLAALTRLAVPRLADWAAVDMLLPDGGIRRVVVEHRDPKKIELALAMRRHRPARVEDRGGIAEVIRSGQPKIFEHITDEMLVRSLGSDPEYLAMVRQAGLVSLMIVPLPVHGQIRGAITFAFAESRRRYTPDDARFAQDLARRAGAAFENALAYGELREANRAKDLFLGRARNLQSVASDLVKASTVDDVARAFARSQRAALAAASSALYVADGDGLRAIAREGVPAVIQPVAEQIPLDVYRDGHARWLASFAAGAETTATTSIAALPLSFGERRIGAIAFGFDSEHAFEAEERAYLVALADLWAQALQRVQLVEVERASLRARFEDQVRSRTRADLLYRLTAALASTMTTSSVAEMLCEHAAQTIGAESAVVWLVDELSGTLVRAARRGHPWDLGDFERIPLAAELPVARAIRERLPVLIASREELAATDPALLEHVPHELQAFVRLPLISGTGKVMGVAAFSFERPAAFTEDDRQLFAAVADQCAVAFDRARAYEAEATALRKKDEFLAMLGHELRNPLAPILTATSLIRMRGGATERELGILERQGQHLVRLVDDLLDVSRIASGKLTLHPQRLEIAEVIAQALEAVGHSFEDKHLHVRIEVPRVGLVVEADRQRLVQVVTNVLVNAAKFTPSSRSVFVHAEKNEGDRSIQIVVRDEGAGVAPELLPGMFELFTQGPQPSDRRGGGLGLGLAIARTIVEAHAGTIRASSPGRGEGTTIIIRLPLAEHGTPEPSPRRIERTPAPHADERRVLIVDDNADGAEMIALFLGELGYQTFVAGDGPEALSIVDRARPDVAILDIGLPGMDGYELAAELRARLGDRTPPLIALTGYAQANDRTNALTSGFRAHFAKPVDLAKLVATVEALAHHATTTT